MYDLFAAAPARQPSTTFFPLAVEATKTGSPGNRRDCPYKALRGERPMPSVLGLVDVRRGSIDQRKIPTERPAFTESKGIWEHLMSSSCGAVIGTVPIDSAG